MLRRVGGAVGPRSAHEPSAYAERVLEVVAQVPAGRVMTYGDVREWLGESSPRAVGVVLAHHGHDVPWWRVVLADGRPAPVGRERALARLAAEGVPVEDGRVDLAAARWDGRPPA
ncbi:MGMT family protein [Vallicoccus soli]|uniref:Cysteine methyltransferase n=1 Tax=Vallicoccus soli TaxID=2339232 RepID=A0A3A3YZZ0_9ACTN|nr:MGMT family protein [Vallicoccus soli]RJK97540.1 cysteine methyltransferase [Vallicoccus soli]